jgi:hypothetical protein
MARSFNRLLAVAKDTESVKAVVLISSAITLSDFEAGNDFPCQDKDYNSQFFLLSTLQIFALELLANILY